MKNLFDIFPTPSFSSELPADSVLENYTRQVQKACYSFAEAKTPSKPELVHKSIKLLEDLEISVEEDEEFLAVMSGMKEFNHFPSYAMCYGGHQFGNWAGQLGDGRAINIAELSINDQPLQFQLKGAGPTPYSRGSDGLAVLRSSIREYLCSEAMHSLGVPSTRALSLVKTGDLVARDILYNGNQKDEQGAIVCRVAPTFIRFGNFQIFASRGEFDVLKKLLDFTIKQHFSHLGEPSKETYIKFFSEVADKTRKMVIHWQRVGFVHGVMNTDNLSILGLTIDYGPYGWLEDYNPGWTPNTTDAAHARYRFGNQPFITLWNLAQLGSALYPLIEEKEELQAIIDDYFPAYERAYHQMMCEKLGLYQSKEIAITFISQLTELMTKSEIDMTMFHRELSGNTSDEFDDFWDIIKKTSYLDNETLLTSQLQWEEWFLKFIFQVKSEGVSLAKRSGDMKRVNPKYVLRNYMAQMAIDSAEEGNYELVDELYQMLLKPYDEQPENEKWFAKRPDWAKHKVGCSMLSCSS